MSYLAEMRESIRQFRQAEMDFAAITAAYAKYGVNGEYKASQDPSRRRAQQNAAYYSARAQMYALAHLAEQGIPVPATAVPAGGWLDESAAPEGAWPGVAR